MYGKFIFGVLGVLSETGVRLLTFIHYFVQQPVRKDNEIKGCTKERREAVLD